VGFSPPTCTHLAGHGGVHSAHVPVVVCPDEVSAEWPVAGGPTRRLSGGRADAPTTRTSAVGRLERGEPGSLGPGGGGLHAVCRRRGPNRPGRPTFPTSTTKWSSSTRLETRTKESNVRASMRVIRKPECGAKAKMGGKWQRSRPGHRTIDLCGFVHTRVRARPLGPERLRTMPV